MKSRPPWLPKELQYADYNGDWDKFLEVVYRIFEHDFKSSCPTYKGFPLVYDSKLESGKEVAFWHLIQRHDCRAQDRVPDLRRCERIPWPNPIIEHSSDRAVSVWKNKRKKPNRGLRTSVLLWLEKLDYLVVLGERPQKMVLVTAYCTDIKSQREKLVKERDNYFKNAKAAPQDDLSTPSTHGR